MFALINIFLLFAETTHKAAEGGFTKFYNEWFNIPGFEAWKFLNLAIFIAIMTYVARKPLGDAFRAKRDEIRSELIKAEAQRPLVGGVAELGVIDPEGLLLDRQGSLEERLGLGVAALLYVECRQAV